LVALLFLAVTYLMTQLFAHGYQIDVSTIAILMSGGLLIVLGNFMSKLRPNWFVGIRTPWTLSSKTAWDRTHRVGGWLFIAGGFVVMASSAAPPAVMLGTCLAVPLVIVAILFSYSYFVWRGDPDKQPPAGTLPASSAENH
jgi:uncharacterized membrane protein